jgi:hypothetical protein
VNCLPPIATFAVPWRRDASSKHFLRHNMCCMFFALSRSNEQIDDGADTREQFLTCRQSVSSIFNFWRRPRQQTRSSCSQAGILARREFEGCGGDAVSPLLLGAIKSEVCALHQIVNGISRLELGDAEAAGHLSEPMTSF